MLINLRQPAIEEALRDYLTKKGITLEGHDVTISFTSGRKNNGLSADIGLIESAGAAGWSNTVNLASNSKPSISAKSISDTSSPEKTKKATSDEIEEIKEKAKVGGLFAS